MPLLGKTDEGERIREYENGQVLKKRKGKKRRRTAAGFSGPGGGMAGVRCDCASRSCNEVRCEWTF